MKKSWWLWILSEFQIWSQTWKELKRRRYENRLETLKQILMKIKRKDWLFTEENELGGV